MPSNDANDDLGASLRTWARDRLQPTLLDRLTDHSPSRAKDGSMPFCVELDNLKDTDAPIHQPAAMLVAAD